MMSSSGPRMLRTIAARLVSVAVVLLVVSLLVYALGTLVRGNIASVIVGSEGATSAQYAEVSRSLGLDDPFIVQYWHWLTGAFRGNLGTSPISGLRVRDVLVEEAPVTFELAVLGSVASVMLGVPSGIFAASRANRSSDRVMRIALLIAFSVPVFLIGVVLLLVATDIVPQAFLLTYAPLDAGLLSNLRSMALPLLTIIASQSAAMMQISRSAMLEELVKPYVRTARAVGVRPRRLYSIHVLRNAASVIVTYGGFQFGVLLGSLIVVEQIYNLPGLGRGLLDAINSRDYPMVTSITMLFAIVFVVVNVVLDSIAPLIQPRLRTRH